MKKLSFAILACSAFVPVVSNAQVLLTDNFDSYVDQAAFVSAWPVIGATPSGTLENTNFVSASQGVFYGLTAQRNERSFAESGVAAGTTAVSFSFNFYDSNSALSPYRQFANLQDGASPTSSGQLVSMGLNNNLTSSAEGGNFYMARILGYNASAYFKLNDNPALLRSSGWHNLAVIIGATDFKFYVDGVLAKTIPQTGLTLRSYDLARLGSGLTSTGETAFDNVRVELVQVPEPGLTALLGVGLAALIAFRRLRK
jgi:hypothetical protein